MNTFSLAITGSQFLNWLLYLIVAGIIFWVILWGLKQIALPEPFAKIAKALLICVVVFILVNFMLDIAGHPLIRWE